MRAPMLRIPGLTVLTLGAQESSVRNQDPQDTVARSRRPLVVTTKDLFHDVSAHRADLDRRLKRHVRRCAAVRLDP